MDLDIILESCDWKLTKKLRHEDPEQFYTLVRMHLSFVLDLTTEDCECPAEKDKLRQLLKWGLAPFSKKARSATKVGLEGQPLTKQSINQVYQLIEFLSKEENIIQEGIFRRSGKLTRQQELKSLLLQGIALDLENGQFSVHDCASVLKNFLADLPEPLLTETYYPAYIQIAELCISEKSSEDRLQRALQLLFLLLPEDNWLMLKDIIVMLHLTASHEGKNKMSAENLATLFTPHLLCPRKLGPEALHTSAQMLSHVVIFMIRSGLELFQVPATLATDIYAYWERKKLSSQTEGNEGTAANTVFSFVDRERTAQENTTNPTEAALAQLYAYIQSLPESNKKRRLVKQFNKENGYGTPRHSSSRTCSIGDSIKKRIFSKSSKGNKLLLENNLLKSGRSSSEELLDSPEYMKSTMPKVKLTFYKTEDADSSIDVSESSKEKLEGFSDGQEKENIETNSCRNFLKISEDNKAGQGLPLSISCTCPVNTSYNNQPSSNNTSAVIKNTNTTSANVEHVVISTPENKVTFFTPPTPVSLKHRHWSISRATCSTPNTKHWTNSMLLNSTPSCNNNCLHSTSPMVASADDMSPITRSTQRMTKAMQETMMTPRSRKPVVALSGSNICHLANTTWGVKEASWSSSENQNRNLRPHMSFEEDSLTSPFKDYLLSRSVLTTSSPVDLSFSSRTGDFDPSSFSDDLLPSPLNGSLLRCMDGNCVGMSSDSESISSRKRDASSLDDKLSSKREKSSSTSGNSSEGSQEPIFETSL